MISWAQVMFFQLTPGHFSSLQVPGNGAVVANIRVVMRVLMQVYYLADPMLFNALFYERWVNAAQRKQHGDAAFLWLTPADIDTLPSSLQDLTLPQNDSSAKMDCDSDFEFSQSQPASCTSIDTVASSSSIKQPTKPRSRSTTQSAPSKRSNRDEVLGKRKCLTKLDRDPVFCYEDDEMFDAKIVGEEGNNFVMRFPNGLKLTVPRKETERKYMKLYREWKRDEKESSKKKQKIKEKSAR